MPRPAAAPSSGAQPLTVQFDDASTGAPTIWLWDFGDGSSFTQQNPTHVYGPQTSTPYTVSLTAMAGTESDTELKLAAISVSVLFQKHPLAPKHSSPDPLLMRDIDGDGDADVLESGSSANNTRWFENRSLWPAWVSKGAGVAGAAGTPLLTASGRPVAGQTVSLNLSGALPFGVAALVSGLSNISAPFKCGALVPSPDVILAGWPLDGSGALQLSSSWPPGVPFLTKL